MNNKFFDVNDSLFEITERYPETVTVFTANGFPHMGDKAKRASLGKGISLKQSLNLKGKGVEHFSALLVETILAGADDVDTSIHNGLDTDAGISVVGALPCPVRLPLLEQIDLFINQYQQETGQFVTCDLKAASQGAAWIETYIDNAACAEELPDLFISAGFETFFDNNAIGKYKHDGVFEDTLPFEGANSSFDSIDIRDPKKDYSMLGVVPAVFLVNTKELGDLPMPQSWEDILKPEFKNRLSLPVGDFDLFSSVLIHIYDMYGEEGIQKLGRNLLESMHPSQMVTSDKKKSLRPMVTIMPYFFTKMTKHGGPMTAVWPSEGAIISPLFMVTKKNTNKNIQPVIDFFASKSMGEILAHNGLFPSLNPEVDNRLEKNNNFLWVGWEFIYNNDIPALITRCQALFNEASSASPIYDADPKG